MGREYLASKRTQIANCYELFVTDYKQYLRLRGFGDHVNDWFFTRRGFLDCWFEPGFHNFWRVWNPGISYFCFCLYLLLGGREHGGLATILVFLVNGILHNLLYSLITGCWTFSLPFTFLSFGVLTVASRHLAKLFNQQRLPALVNAAVNSGLVLVSFDLGFRMAAIL